jgi:excisionase family DNA binding protein
MAAMAEMDPHTALISQAALADRLDVSVATLARARKKGDLRDHRVGGQWRYSEQQITDYLKRTEQPLRLYGRCPNDSDTQARR